MRGAGLGDTGTLQWCPAVAAAAQRYVYETRVPQIGFAALNMSLVKNNRPIDKIKGAGSVIKNIFDTPVYTMYVYKCFSIRVCLQKYFSDSRCFL